AIPIHLLRHIRRTSRHPRRSRARGTPRLSRAARGTGAGTTAAAPTIAQRTPSVVDLHVHYPMHLLGGVESPRDVAEQMLEVRAREAGKVRAAILNGGARLFNFRHWDGDWRVSVPLLQRGGVSVACSVLLRPFSALDIHA